MMNMFVQIFPTRLSRILLLIFSLSFIWWLDIYFRNQVNTTESYLFNVPIGLIPILNGVMIILRTRTEQNKIFKKSAIFLSLSMILLGSGAWAWLYYNFFQGTAVPLLSIADIFYLTNNYFGFVGFLFLCSLVGLQRQLEKLKQYFLFFSPIGLILFLFYFIMNLNTGSTVTFDSALQLFFDVIYPMTDVLLLLPLGLLLFGLFSKQVEKQYWVSIIILFSATVLFYIDDLFYSYTIDNGTFFVGSWVDMLFLTALFLLSIGNLLLFYIEGSRTSLQGTTLEYI